MYFKKIIELIYPTKCGFCGKLSKTAICNICFESLKSSLKIENQKEVFFTKHVYVAKYDGKLRDIFLGYKFSDKSYLYRFFAEIILKTNEMYSFFKNYDIIIPVPINKKRRLNRSYNQSELIAKYIARQANIRFEDVLIKNKNNLPQSTLNKEQRRHNVKQVYSIKKVDTIVNRNILLFDDIYTTGSTVNECSKVLINAGAKNVDVLTIFKD